MLSLHIGQDLFYCPFFSRLPHLLMMALTLSGGPFSIHFIWQQDEHLSDPTHWFVPEQVSMLFQEFNVDFVLLESPSQRLISLDLHALFFFYMLLVSHLIVRVCTGPWHNFCQLFVHFGPILILVLTLLLHCFYYISEDTNISVFKYNNIKNSINGLKNLKFDHIRVHSSDGQTFFNNWKLIAWSNHPMAPRFLMLIQFFVCSASVFVLCYCDSFFVRTFFWEFFPINCFGSCDDHFEPLAVRNLFQAKTLVLRN